MKRPWKIALAGLAAVLAAFWLYGFFVSRMGGAGRTEAAAVVLTAPPGFAVERVGALSAAAAAGALVDLAGADASKTKVGVDYAAPDGARVILLLDRLADTVDERKAGATGTRVQTVYRGHALERLARARASGDLDVPGLPPGEKKNLYH